MPKTKNSDKKHLCKLSKKDIENRLDKIIVIVNNPQYLCAKCARVANEEVYLCHPKKL